MDLDEQNQDAAKRKYKGVLSDDTEQMKQMIRGAMDSPDYRDVLIQTCQRIISPPQWKKAGQLLERIDWEEAVKCAEALGKRDFILEVMPSPALDLVIDCTKKGGK